MDFGDRSDNPFSGSFTKARTSRTQALKSAIRFFLVVCVCLVVSLAITSQGPKWLVHRLTRDFESLNAHEKKERLVQIADLGPPAIPCLVQSLADPDLEIARTAYELLQQAQNDWSVMNPSDRADRHSAMVRSLKTIAVHLPEDRTGWGTSLLQQTLMETVDRNSDDARQLYGDANHVIELLSLTARAHSADPVPDSLTMEFDHDSQDPKEPRRLSVRARPLPVDQSQAAEAWTQWPPPRETRYDHDVEVDALSQGTRASAIPTETTAPTDSPSVYRSGSKLQAVASEDEVALDLVGDGNARSLQEVDADSSTIQPVAHLVDSPLETYDDASVMRWLGSEHAALRDKAESELVRRGYGPSEISLATQIVTADTQARLGLVNAIAQSGRVDPRPWLLMLLDDPSRDVKLRVISVLATMNDPTISQRLQLHLVDEEDPTVAARIRRVLKLR
jgi:hypothetical protein